MATGLRATERWADDGEAPRTVRSYEHGEVFYADPDVDAASKHGKTLRGTGREAGRYEQALRLLGRKVNTENGALILVVDQGDGLMMRMITKEARDLPYRYVTFGTTELGRILDEAFAARTSADASAFPHPTRPADVTDPNGSGSSLADPM